jgi:hypothetical protein
MNASPLCPLSACGEGKGESRGEAKVEVKLRGINPFVINKPLNYIA